MFLSRLVKVRTTLVLALLIFFQAVPINPGLAAVESTETIHTGAATVENNSAVNQAYDPVAVRLVVETVPGTDLPVLAAATGGEVVRTGPLNYCTIQYRGKGSPDGGDAQQQIDKDAIRRRILQYPEVLNAEWSRTYTIDQSAGKSEVQAFIDDPQYSLQWALKKIRANQVWDEGATGEGVIVAVVDTGVDLDHPDLVDYAKKMNNLVQGYNAITRSTLPDAPQDDHGHGTAVAGVIAALNNNKGIVGIAYNAKIMPIKAMDQTGEGEDSIIADGIIWAADHGARIINMSIGSSEQTKVLDDALHYAANKGCLLVAASGNNAKSEEPDLSIREKSSNTGVAYPAAHPDVVAVSGVDINDRIASFALTGPEVALSAPGQRILTDYWSREETGCGYTSGTSIAAPFVSAAAALLWSRYPHLSSEEIKKALTSSALDLGSTGRDNEYGFGRIDAYRALKTLQEQKSFLSPAALGWEGGRIYTGGTAEKPQAVLTVPAGAFVPQVDHNGTESKVSLSLQETLSPGDFPAGIIPAGEALKISPWGEVPVKHPLSLSVRLELPENAGQEARLAYLYLWSDTRWIRVGGGVPETADSLEATIYEPGIYRAGWSAEPAADRISGLDRIHTALEIARQAFPTGTDTVLVTRSDNFPDALAGAPLAYKYHAPIILTSPEALPPEVAQAIRDLAPKRIIILGGTGAVSAAVESQLQNIAYVSRIAGETRFVTASAIAELLGTTGQAVIVNSANFPDAIAAAAPAALSGKPILLTPGDKMVLETENSLRKLSVVETEVIGGPAAIQEDLLTMLPCPTRINGSDRYATSAVVVELNRPRGKVLYVATGLKFPDALTGGILAAANSSDILLLSPQGLTPAQINVLQTLGHKKVVALGGEGAVSSQTLKELQTLLQ